MRPKYGELGAVCGDTVTGSEHDGIMSTNHDQTIVKLAMANGGAVSTQLLKAEGINSRSVLRRVHDGSLERVFKGVYLANAVRNHDSPLHAACLAQPAGAAFRFTAAYLHGFDVKRPAIPQFVVMHSHRANSHLLEIHETRDLPEVDVKVVDGIRVTSPSRTICDIAPYVKPAFLRHLIETQLSRKRPTPDEIVACVRSRRRSGVRSVGELYELLGIMLDDEPFPESALEIRLFQALAAGGVTGLTRQFRPPWYDGIRGIVDAADPIGKTIIEADGRQFRQVTQAHNNDRQRDRTAAGHGFAVLRVGHQELAQRRAAVVGEIRGVVMARRRAALKAS